MCSSRKYPYPPQGGLLEISRGRRWSGPQKPKFVKERYEPKWNFGVLWRVWMKNPWWKGFGLFLNNTM